MKTRLIICLFFVITPFFLTAQYNPKALEKAEEAVTAFKTKNAKFETYFGEAYGYAVFPSIGKGASGIGVARGSGIVFEQGNPIGKAKLSQVTVGLQFGGQAYRQIIFFETAADLQRFKTNKFEFAAGASAIAVKTGAATNLAYHDGVAVFTITKAGLMYEAALGGQKLKFKPFKGVNQTKTTEASSEKK